MRAGSAPRARTLAGVRKETVETTRADRNARRTAVHEEARDLQLNRGGGVVEDCDAVRRARMSPTRLRLRRCAAPCGGGVRSFGTHVSPRARGVLDSRIHSPWPIRP